MSRIAMPVQTGEVIDFINGTADAISVGDVVPLKTFCGVAETDLPPGGEGAVAITRVWDVPAVSGTAFAAGDVLFWNAANKQATLTTTNNTPLGVCVAPKASGQTVARVKIAHVATVNVTINNGA
jgi:predicted RecA/RadA family phage recombinase